MTWVHVPLGTVTLTHPLFIGWPAGLVAGLVVACAAATLVSVAGDQRR